MHTFTPIKQTRRHQTISMQNIYRFLNLYGASVLCREDETPVELAVIRFTDSGDNDWQLTYDTPITADVITNFTQTSLNQVLEQIAALPKQEPNHATS